MPGIYKRASELAYIGRRYEPFIEQLMLLAKAYDEDQVLAFLEPYAAGAAARRVEAAGRRMA